MQAMKERFGLKTVAIGMVVLTLAILQYFLTTEPWVVPVVTPMTGVAVAIVIFFGRQAYLPAGMALFLGEMSYLYLLGDVMHVLYPPFVSLFAVGILFVQCEIARKFLPQGTLLKHVEKPDRKTLLILLQLAVVVGLVSALGASLRLALWDYSFLNIPRVLLLWYAHALSFLIFMPLVHLSLTERMGIRKKDRTAFLKTTVFLGIFVITLILVSFLPATAFLRQQLYLTILFFLLGALLLSYRALFALVVLLLVITRVFFITSEGAQFVGVMITLYTFTAVAVALALLLKHFRDLQSEKTRALVRTTRDLDNTISYIRGFFSLSKELFRRRFPFKDIARETFDMTVTLFNPDAAYGYFDNEGVIDMFSVKNHSMKRIPFLYELHDATEIRKRSVLFYPDVHLALKKRYGESYLRHNREDTTFMRALLVFRLRPRHFFVIGLDFDENTPLKDVDTLRMREFTDLLNKLFTKNYVTIRKVEIKDDIILTLVRALELYDRHTKGHSEDVAEIATKIGERMGLSEDSLRDLHYAGLLHDIGKLGIDADVLNKNGDLTTAEYEKVKEHVRLSHEALSGVPELERIRRAIWDHHEHFDGKGYPEGLKGEEISLTGRILVVADALATMPAERPYGTIRDKTETIEELRRHSGGQFCPKVAAIAVRLVEEGHLDHLFA